MPKLILPTKPLQTPTGIARVNRLDVSARGDFATQRAVNSAVVNAAAAVAASARVAVYVELRGQDMHL